ncbi:hypothetical protein [Bacillus mycoides]|uniref:hypothetical protein n=2 Tax=Bacillus mycoides TaxID=1405 RepID=UPI001F1E0C10|nr:hypothetical protein [Bacillus mycoides]
MFTRMACKSYNILRGQGCPGCRNKSLSKERKKTKEQYAAEVLEVHGDNIEVIGTYKGARNTTEHKCNSCKNIWEAERNFGIEIITRFFPLFLCSNTLSQNSSGQRS